MEKKILLISEVLSVPFDEGVKNVVFSVCRQANFKKNVLIVTKKGNDTGDIRAKKIKLNRFFVNYELRLILKYFSPDIILYISKSSYSIGAFLRMKILKLMNASSKTVLLGVQHKDCLDGIKGEIIKNFLKPSLVMLMNKFVSQSFVKKKIKVKILPPAVDTNKFCPLSKEDKKRLRIKYNVPSDKTIVLHVGHIKVNRNIECFLNLQKLENIQVVIVGSTSIAIENDLKNRLIEENIIVINKYIPDISEIYKMSDIYVFPVVNVREAIDMPLSVLEAMACNLPVIATRFGALADFFKEDLGFRYFSTAEELTTVIKSFMNMDYSGIFNNRKKVEHFTWENFYNNIIEACEELV